MDSLASDDDLEMLSSEDDTLYEDQGISPYKRHIAALIDHDYTALYPSRKKRPRIKGILFCF